jgi:hypothetical protein
LPHSIGLQIVSQVIHVVFHCSKHGIHVQKSHTAQLCPCT